MQTRAQPIRPPRPRPQPRGLITLRSRETGAEWLVLPGSRPDAVRIEEKRRITPKHPSRQRFITTQRAVENRCDIMGASE